MDKLRALRYFVTAAKSGSFTRAAGQLGVSVPAVQKLVNQVERDLGARLLTRSPQGLALTAAGIRYLFDVERALADIDRADDRVRPRSGELAGTVVIACPTHLIDAIFAPVFATFVKRYPNITLEFKSFVVTEDIARAGIDVYLTYGWFAPPDMVLRPLILSHFVTVATPQFWDQHGRPTHPKDLASLPCLTLRSLAGTLMDLWDYEREGEIVRVPVKGPATFDNAQRDSLMHLLRLGHGVFLTGAYLTAPLLESGELEAVLPDWKALGAPPLQMHFSSDARADPAVSAVLDFIAEQFDANDANRASVSPRPDWAEKKLPRASLHLE